MVVRRYAVQSTVRSLILGVLMLLSTACVPKLPPMTIRRDRLEQWLRSYAQYPARLVVAPAGSGKTSLLLKYCANSDRETYYFALPENCDPAQLRELLAKTLGSARVSRSYAAMLDVVNGSPAHCREIVVDDMDNGTPETRSELIQLIEDVGDNITLIYAGRAREHIDARRLIARGVAALCDARRLAFDAEECALLCEACGVDASDLQVRRLIEDTDGWPIAVSGAIRTAAAERQTLERGYQSWLSQSQAFLYDFVRAELERVPERHREPFWQCCNGAASLGPARLRELESLGLFVIDEGGDRLRLYRPLSAPGKGAAQTSTAAPHAPPLMVQLFQSFSARIDNRDIQWVRKRDQQIVKYLLLKPNGTATREELVSVFWADTDRHLATQSVRTACSTIRKAFAAAVGPSNVDRYFRTVPELQLDLSNVVCDVRRFSAHISDAQSAYASGDKQNAAMHYRAAERLYAGALLEFEGAEEWFTAHTRALEEQYLLLLERLGDMALEEGQYITAQQYAQRAQVLQRDLPGVVQLVEKIAAARPLAGGVAEIASKTRHAKQHAQLQTVS